jgi:hypothetical protein
MFAMASFAGLAYTQVMINSQLKIANDLTMPVADVKRKLDSPQDMVSFGAADHRFCYYYGTTIKELPWPTRMEDVPENVTCFCFTRSPTDTAEKRTSGRFWNWTTTSGVLPFQWEEIAVVACDRKRSDSPLNKMVIGRIIRPSSGMAKELPCCRWWFPASTKKK